VDDAVHKLANLNILKRTRLGAGATMAGEGDELLQVRWLHPSEQGAVYAPGGACLLPQHASLPSAQVTSSCLSSRSGARP